MGELKNKISGIDYSLSRILFVAFVFFAFTTFVSALSLPYVWIGNGVSGTISVINKTSNAVAFNISGVGQGGWDPLGIAVDNESIWVTRNLDNKTSRINMTSNQVIANISLNFSPVGIAVDPQFVWVTGYNTSTNVSSLVKINKTSNAIDTSYFAGTFAYGVAVDNNFVWVANEMNNSIWKLNKSSNFTIIPLPGIRPKGIAIDPQGNVWFTDSLGGKVFRMNGVTNALELNVSTGVTPVGIAVDNDSVWVANNGNMTVVKLNKTSGAIQGVIVTGSDPVLHNPFGVSLDDNFAWVTVWNRNVTMKLNKTSGASIENITVGIDPTSFGDSTGYAYETLFGGGAPPSNGTGNINGTVYNASSNQTIANASITLFGLNITTLTNGSGFYNITNITAANYSILANASGFTAQAANISVSENQTIAQNFYLNGTGGAPPSNGTGNLTGYVWNLTTGVPLSGANVTLSPFNSTFTNSSGYYTFTNVSAGSYSLFASADNFSVGYNPNLTIVANTTTSFNFTLNATGPGGGFMALTAYCSGNSSGNATVYGRITNSTGGNVSGAGVSVHIDYSQLQPGQFAEGCSGWTQTDGNGTYNLTGFGTGIYEIFVDPPLGSDYSSAKANNVNISSTNQTIGRNFTLGSGGKLIVNVTAGGSPVAFAGVNAFVPWDPMNPSAASSGGFAWGQTSANGTVTLSGLTNGTYMVHVEPPFGSAYSRKDVSNISVTEGTTQVINITLSTAGSISGFIFAPNATNTSQLLPVANAFLNAFVPWEDGGGFGGGSGWAQSNSSGGFTISGLPNGSYQVEVEPPFDSNVSRGFAKSVVVIEGNTTLINFTLKAGSALSGRIKLANGSGVGFAFVNVFIPSTSPFTPPSDFGYAATDGNGDYIIRGLKAGKYEITVWPPFGSGLSTGFAHDVNITAGQTTVQNLTLSSGGRLSGRVTANGSGIAYAYINAFIPSTDPGKPPSGFGWGQTDANGSYNLTGLVSGLYKVHVEPPYGTSYTSGNGDANITEGNETQLNFTLGSGGSITGKIVNAANSSVSGAFVNAWSQTAFSFGYDGTSDDGTFTISGLSPGSDYVLFINPPYGSTTGYKTVTGVTVSSGTTDLGNIALVAASGGLDGYITYSNGTPITTARVNAWSKTAFSYGSTTVNDSGYYNLTSLEAGNFDMFVDFGIVGVPNKFDSNVSVNATVVQRNYTYNASTFATLNGTISSNGSGLFGAFVDIWNETAFVGQHAETNVNGTYIISLPVGSYHMNVFKPGYFSYFNDSITVNNVILNISLNSTSSVTTYSISGNVSVNATATSGLLVIAIDPSSDTSYSNVSIVGGAYSISGLLPAVYNVTAVSGNLTASAVANVTTSNVTKNITIS